LCSCGRGHRPRMKASLSGPPKCLKAKQPSDMCQMDEGNIPKPHAVELMHGLCDTWWPVGTWAPLWVSTKHPPNNKLPRMFQRNSLECNPCTPAPALVAMQRPWPRPEACSEGHRCPSWPRPEHQKEAAAAPLAAPSPEKCQHRHWHHHAQHAGQLCRGRDDQTQTFVATNRNPLHNRCQICTSN
jgi:hypothetical protein